MEQRRIAFGCVVWLALPGLAAASQDTLAAEPAELQPDNVYEVEDGRWMDPNDPRHPNFRFLGWPEDSLTLGAFIQEQELSFRRLQWSGHEAAKAQLDRQLGILVRNVEDSLQRLELAGLSMTAEQQAQFLDSMPWTDVRWFEVNNLDGRSGFFRGEEGDFDILVWDVEAEVEYLLPRVLVEDARYLIAALNEAFERFVRGDLRGRMVDELGKGVSRWSAFFEDGYSMLPWESWANGVWLKGSYDILNPPKRQWILAHPSLGFELSTGDGFNQIRGQEVLAIELIGHLRYTDDTYSNYWGGSLLATLREDLPVGLGAMVHAGRNLHFGITWRDVDDDGAWFDDDPFLMLGLDLYGLWGRWGERETFLP